MVNKEDKEEREDIKKEDTEMMVIIPHYNI